MDPASLERVFGRSRLKMVTGRYVEVYREAAAPGERRRYTKRFLATEDGDFREWTEREWRILARLFGHGVRHVPDIVQYDRGAVGGDALVQTYDAGVTVDHWATLLPVQRDGRVQRHVFQDCAHWWALARHMLLALHEIHALRLVHLDLKADNICLPLAPADFDPAARGQRLFPAFEDIALIDFAFSIVSGEAPTSPLPIGWQRTFLYQSPRLLQALEAGQRGDLEPTRQLDWRCDMYSLAALLNAFLPAALELDGAARTRGWTDALHREAQALLLKVGECHDREASGQLPHPALAAACAVPLETAALAGSLQRGWSLSDGIVEDDATRDTMTTTAPLTRVTLIEPQSAFTAVTAVLPRPPDAVTRPPADADVAVPGLRPAAEPIAVAREQRDAATDAPSAAPTARDPMPVEPMSARPPAASAGVAARGKRPAAVYLLPLLALVAASGWWLAHDTASPVDDPPAASTSRAGVDAATAAKEVAPVVVPDAPRPTAAPAEPSAIAAGTVAAPPSAGNTGQPPALPPERSPPVADVRPPATTASGAEPPGERFAQQAQQAFAGVVPRVVASAEPRVAQVLSIADRAQDPSDDRLTLAAAGTIGDGVFKQVGSGPAATAPVQARQFNAAAQRAFYQERSVVRAYELQRQAFGAHPADAEIAGNLAFYALKMDPPRAEESRALAIYALALSTRAQGSSRREDWGNLAVASALSGRSADARKAMLVLLSVSRDVNRSCHSALSSVASHGPAMRMPAEALLSRAQDRVDVATAPQCQLPPKWR